MNACVLDTDVVIGALDRQDAHHAEAGELLTRMLDGGRGLHLSVINYAEALVKPAEDETTLQRAVEAIAALRIKLHAPDPAIGRDAAGIRGLGVSLADGFALASARRLGAEIASFDARVRSAAGELRIGVATP